MELTAIETLKQEERTQLDRIAGIENNDDKNETLFDAFWRLYVNYTSILALNTTDYEALEQCYRLCCQWVPSLDPEMKKVFGDVHGRVAKAYYARIGTKIDLDAQVSSVLCLCRSYRILAVSGLMPIDIVSSTINNYCEKVTAISGSRADILCILADNCLWSNSGVGMSSETTRHIAEEFAQAASLYKDALILDPSYIDALLGLFYTTGDSQCFARIKRLDASAVYIATFGRIS